MPPLRPFICLLPLAGSPAGCASPEAGRALFLGAHPYDGEINPDLAGCAVSIDITRTYHSAEDIVTTDRRSASWDDEGVRDDEGLRWERGCRAAWRVGDVDYEATCDRHGLPVEVRTASDGVVRMRWDNQVKHGLLTRREGESDTGDLVTQELEWADGRLVRAAELTILDGQEWEGTLSWTRNEAGWPLTQVTEGAPIWGWALTEWTEADIWTWDDQGRLSQILDEDDYEIETYSFAGDEALPSASARSIPMSSGEYVTYDQAWAWTCGS